MENNEDMEFWKDGSKKEEAQKQEEMGDDEMGGMKLKVPKPLFQTPTKCKLVEAKFFKNEQKTKDSKQIEYTAFHIILTFVENGGKQTEFKETYRGGRLYTNVAANGTSSTSMYIGPTSALGRFKAVCIDGGLQLGASLKEWAAAVNGTDCIMKSEKVMYQGKSYEKNFPYSITKVA